MENFLFSGLKVYKLDNGFTVIFKKYPVLPLISVQLWTKVGSIFEDDTSNGISHFLEHLVFKGTQKYPGKQISKTIENYGGILNAGTAKEFTVYFTDIPKEGLNDAIDVIKELVFEAVFPEEEIEKEKLVVIEEIKRSEDNPGNVLVENFNSMLFKDTPYKFRVIGKEENIRNFTKEKIVEYYKKFYQPENMVLCICGDIEFENVEKLIQENFGNYRKTTELPILPSLKEPKKNNIVETKKHKVQHTYFICGFLGPEINDNLQYTGDVLSIIIGEGKSSRLYKLLREEKQLVYEISSGFYTQIGPSVFYISGVCERKNLDNVISEIKSELKKVLVEGVENNELEKAKQIITTRWYFGNETVHSQAQNLSWWYIFKSLDELKLYLDNIKKVDIQQIKEFISTYGDYLVVFALEPEK